MTASTVCPERGTHSRPQGGTPNARFKVAIGHPGRQSALQDARLVGHGHPIAAVRSIRHGDGEMASSRRISVSALQPIQVSAGATPVAFRGCVSAVYHPDVGGIPGPGRAPRGDGRVPTRCINGADHKLVTEVRQQPPACWLRGRQCMCDGYI